MEYNELNYILEITGKDYNNKNRFDQEDSVAQHVPFKETNYFATLREAFESLLRTDIRKFEEMSEGASNDRYCEYAAIATADDKKPILEIVRLSFNDTPEGMPPAGIYMHFYDSTAKEFEDISDFKLGGFRNYDPGSPFLLLASYSYNQGFNITVDPELTNWVRELEYYELVSENETEWKYKVGITRNSLGSPLSQEITNYHYWHLPGAFHQLLRTDVTAMDKEIAERTEQKNWIANANLSERTKEKLVEFVTVKDFSSNEAVAEPGVHLKFYTPIEQMEQQSGVILTRVGNYGEEDDYLLVANYYKDFSQLLPHPGYLALTTRATEEQLRGQPIVEQGPYRLKVTWENAEQPAGDDSTLNQPQVQNNNCASLADALSCMKELDNHFFDKQQTLRLCHLAYIKQADIIDISNNAVVVSKFQVSGKNAQLPAGIYMKLNEDYVSVEMLKLLRSHIREAAQVDSLQFLIAGIKPSQMSSTAEALKRKRAATGRTISPPKDTGPKL